MDIQDRRRHLTAIERKLYKNPVRFFENAQNCDFLHTQPQWQAIRETITGIEGVPESLIDELADWGVFLQKADQIEYLERTFGKSTEQAIAKYLGYLDRLEKLFLGIESQADKVNTVANDLEKELTSVPTVTAGDAPARWQEASDTIKEIAGRKANQVREHQDWIRILKEEDARKIPQPKPASGPGRPPSRSIRTAASQLDRILSSYDEFKRSSPKRCVAIARIINTVTGEDSYSLTSHGTSLRAYGIEKLLRRTAGD